MSGFTITAGVSFSGGFTMTDAPAENTAAWFGGGATLSPFQGLSTVDRITFATDTATATVRGPLSGTRYSVGAVANTTDGWWAGGQAFGNKSTVQRITYATDTATASVRGPLSAAAGFNNGTAGNTTDGWFVSVGAATTVNRITYATDTATASIRGPISENYYGGGAAGIQ